MREKPLKLRPVSTESSGELQKFPPIQRFWLRVIEGEDRGKQHVSRDLRASIGTSPGSDLALTDRTVSRYHCEIELREQRLLVKDLDSRNGTLVNGLRIREAYLGHGATLSLGRSRVSVELDPEFFPPPCSEATSFGRLVGGSLLMRQVFLLLERAAGTDAPVLLLGEHGTGKGTAALSLHEAGPRKNGPFLLVNGGAQEDVATALFGDGQTPGALDLARDGTLYIEELGALSQEIQGRLAQHLEANPCPRIICSSRHDLRGDVNSGRFRSNLYYRLAVVEVRMPPLRERPEDLAQLAGHLLGAEATPELLRGLDRSPWPGNVSELRNHLERVLALGQPSSAEPPPGETTLAPLRIARERALQSFERAYLERLLSVEGGNVTAAARTAGVDRVHLYRLLWRYGLK